MQRDIPTTLDMLEEAQRLRSERRPFAMATVVAAKQPASGMPGARAIILADGEIEGWIGGSCAQPAVIRQALDALADGMPRLLVLRPDVAEELEEEASPGPVQVPMLCASEGELQIFVEPFLPKIELVVIGSSPVARALSRFGKLLDFSVWACDAEADMEAFPDASRLIPDLEALRPQLNARQYVIVATVNRYDEAAARVALESDASYVGVIASQKRFAALRETLRSQGVSAERLARLKRPKGLPGPILQPPEIAFSVMAELIKVRQRRIGMEVETVAVSAGAARAEAIDPICGMTVDIATARYHTERGGETFYFCCAGCLKAFEASAS